MRTGAAGWTPRRSAGSRGWTPRAPSDCCEVWANATCSPPGSATWDRCYELSGGARRPRGTATGRRAGRFAARGPGRSRFRPAADRRGTGVLRRGPRRARGRIEPCCGGRIGSRRSAYQREGSAPPKQHRICRPPLEAALGALGPRPRKERLRPLILGICGARDWTTAGEMARRFRFRPKNLTRRHLGPMVAEGLLEHRYPDRPHHPRQA